MFSLLLGTSAAAHYYIYHQSSVQQALLSAHLTRLEQRQHNWQNEVQKLTEQLAQQAEDRSQIQQVITLQAERLQQLQHHIAHISGNCHYGLLIEVYQLINRAAYTVWLEQEGRAADQLLQRADLILATLHDVNVLPIRQALAQDRDQLAALYSPEGESLMVQLMRLADQAAGLPLAATQFPGWSIQHPTQPPIMVNNANTMQGGWKQVRQYGLRFLKNFIMIQHDENNSACCMQRLPLEYQREYLRINLLLAAQAAIQYRTTAYQQALNNVMKRVSTYFDLKQQGVQTFLQQITVLYQRPTRPSLSQPFNSQRLLAQLLQEQPAKGMLPGARVQ